MEQTMRKSQAAALSSKKSKGAEALGIGFGSDKGMDAEDIKMMGGDDMMDGPTGNDAASMGLADMDKPESPKKKVSEKKIDEAIS